MIKASFYLLLITGKMNDLHRDGEFKGNDEKIQKKEKEDIISNTITNLNINKSLTERLTMQQELHAVIGTVCLIFPLNNAVFCRTSSTWRNQMSKD